jgi:hypothetical protein
MHTSVHTASPMIHRRSLVLVSILALSVGNASPRSRSPPHPSSGGGSSESTKNAFGCAFASSSTPSPPSRGVGAMTLATLAKSGRRRDSSEPMDKVCSFLSFRTAAPAKSFFAPVVWSRLIRGGGGEREGGRGWKMFQFLVRSSLTSTLLSNDERTMASLSHE